MLDGRGNTYLQLVQQVRQALRVGLLEPAGLVQGRPGVGTFVTGALAGESLDGGAAHRDDDAQ